MAAMGKRHHLGDDTAFAKALDAEKDGLVLPLHRRLALLTRGPGSTPGRDHGVTPSNTCFK